MGATTSGSTTQGQTAQTDSDDRPADGPMLSFEETVGALRAAAEPTRLRILAVLARIDLTVGELCRVLGQTQPRVSRHLRLMVDAGLLDRYAEGSFAFYRPASDRLSLYGHAMSMIDPADPVLERDRQRLDRVRTDRAELAARYFERIARSWDRVRSLHVADTEVEAAMVAAVAGRPIGTLIDIGTGTGRVLELFADHIERGIGIDLSREMLNLARSQLDRPGLRHCSVYQADIYDLRLASGLDGGTLAVVDPGSVDVAVMHHVLHFLDDPASAVAEAARILAPNGLLLVVDFAPHDREHFRHDFEHRFLGFAAADVERWCHQVGLDSVSITHLSKKTDGDSLTVTLWAATRAQESPPAPSTRSVSRGKGR